MGRCVVAAPTKATGVTPIPIPPDSLAFATPSAMAHTLTKGEYKRPPHIEYISDHLVDIATGRNNRLICNLPPGHGKSSLISHYFPVWYEYLYPERLASVIGYGDDFAVIWGKRTRETVMTNPWLGIDIKPGFSAAHSWETVQGGGVVALGIGGSLMGRRFHLCVIDDPIKQWASLSDVQRENLWDWWVSVARTRLEPGGAIVVVMHRWAEDDFTGRLLRSSADKWTVLKLPALAEPDDPLGRPLGEPLWPERFSKEALEAARLSDPRVWAAMYQQQPLPFSEEGIPRTAWRYFTIPPSEFDLMLQSWDFNFKKTTSGSYTVGQVWGLKAAQFYLLDQVRKRMDMDEAITEVMALTVKWPGALVKLVEDAAMGTGIISLLRKYIPGFLPIPAKFSKEVRVRGKAVAPVIQSGNVLLPANAPWVPEFIAEWASFPHAQSDDQVDCASQALTWMYNRVSGSLDATHGQGLLDNQKATTARDEFRARWQAMIAPREKAINPYTMRNR